MSIRIKKEEIVPGLYYQDLESFAYQRTTLQNSYHMRPLFYDLEEIVATAKKEIQNIPFEALVGTGLSGVALVPLLAWEMDKRFGLLRKQRSPHSEVIFETNMNLYDRYIFVDDCIASGATFRRVIDAMRSLGYNNFVGAFLYAREVSNGHFKSVKRLRKARPDLTTKAFKI